MPPLGQQRRPFVIQEIDTFAVTVGTVATPLSNDQSLLQSYISSVIINLPSVAAESIFWGNRTVTIASGLEIVAGTSINLAVNNTRQLYELEFPIRDIAEFLKCLRSPATDIPVVVFDPTQVALVSATGGIDARVSLFRSAYV